MIRRLFNKKSLIFLNYSINNIFSNDKYSFDNNFKYKEDIIIDDFLQEDEDDKKINKNLDKIKNRDDYKIVNEIDLEIINKNKKIDKNDINNENKSKIDKNIKKDNNTENNIKNINIIFHNKENNDIDTNKILCKNKKECINFNKKYTNNLDISTDDSEDEFKNNDPIKENNDNNNYDENEHNCNEYECEKCNGFLCCGCC